MGEFGIGQPVPREEDPYLVRGDGRYVDDVSARRADARLCAALTALARHASKSIDVEPRAAARPASLQILTGNDPAVLALGLQRPRHRASAATARRSSPRRSRCSRATRVRYIGEPVAMVIAETLERGQGRRRADRGRLRGPAGGRPRWRRRSRLARRRCGTSCPDNIAFLHEVGNKAATEKAIAAADHVIKHRMRDQPPHHRVDGAARLSRRIRSARRPLHAALHGAGTAHRCGAPWRRTCSGSRTTRSA